MIENYDKDDHSHETALILMLSTFGYVCGDPSN
jgi:hypothetical protein